MLKAHAYPTMHAVAAPAPEVTTAPPKPVDTTSAWLEYVTGRDTVEAIAERHGHSVPALRKRAFREQWGAERVAFRQRAHAAAVEFSLTSLEDKQAQFQAEMHAICMQGTEALKRGLENLGDTFKPRDLHNLVRAGYTLLRTAQRNLGTDKRAGKSAAPPMVMPEVVFAPAYDLSRLSRAESEQLSAIAAKVKRGA